LIGFLGASRAGKSTLINTLLDYDDLLPADDDKACTASVVEIAYNLSDEYEATVERISSEDWRKELDDLFQDLAAQKEGDDGDENNPDLERDLRIKEAFQKVKCVYPELETLEKLGLQSTESLLSHSNVVDILGKEQTYTSSEIYEFAAYIKPYVASGATEIKSGNMYAQWPLVRLVKLRVPSELLSTGLVLVDLPGSLDANIARGAVAEKYQKNLDVSCVVAPAVRAATDQPVSHQYHMGMFENH
jgi:hypothetical protein